jgi:hypothetical protein
MCVVHQKSVNKLDLTWKQSFLFLILSMGLTLGFNLGLYLWALIKEFHLGFFLA